MGAAAEDDDIAVVAEGADDGFEVDEVDIGLDAVGGEGGADGFPGEAGAFVDAFDQLSAHVGMVSDAVDDDAVVEGPAQVGGGEAGDLFAAAAVFAGDEEAGPEVDVVDARGFGAVALGFEAAFQFPELGVAGDEGFEVHDGGSGWV